MKKIIPLIFINTILLLSILSSFSNGLNLIDCTCFINNPTTNKLYYGFRFNDINEEEIYFPFPLLHSNIKIINKGFKQISIKAEDAGTISSNLGANIGPLWLSKNFVQFTIYEGDTEIQINGEKQVISDFPIHVLLFNFFGFGSMPYLRFFKEIDTLYLFGFSREIVITPYNEIGLTMHDQALFNIGDIQDLGQCAWGLASADFNHDGWNDFAVSSRILPPNTLPTNGGGSISIFYNNRDMSFTRKTVYTYSETYSVEDLESGDFDGDEDIDLMFTYSETMDIGGGLMMKTNGTVNLLFNDGEGNFLNETMVARHCSEDPYSHFGRINPQLTTSDYDRDGDIDFLVGDNSGMVEYYTNDGFGKFSSQGIIHDFGAFSWGLTTYDFDGDDDEDVLVASGIYQELGSDDGCIYLIQNMIIESNSTITFNPGKGEELIYYSSVCGGACLQSIEYNNDGNMDLILGRNDRLNLYLRTDDSFEFFPLNQFAMEKGTNDIRLGGLSVSDYNNDGKEDLIAGGVLGIVRMLWNNYSEFLPPLRPQIIQPTDVEYKPGEEMKFGFLSNDVNSNDIFYKIDWGDGMVTDWIGPYHSGQQLDLHHVWNEEGGYWIRAIAKNSNGAESGWTKYRLILIDN